jgi:hypothetical protein
MKDARDLLNHVPVGEEKAIPSRLIWQEYGLWSPTGIRRKLNDMAVSGLIERKMVASGGSQKGIYFRKAPAGS